MDFEVFTASGHKIWQTWQDNQQLTGESQTYSGTWQVPASQTPGGYYVSIGIFSPGWSTLWAWKHQAAIFSIAPESGTGGGTGTDGAGNACTSDPTIQFVSASGTPNPVERGTTARLSVTFTASCATTGLVDYAVYDSTGHLVYQKWIAGQHLSGQQQTFSVTWKIRSRLAPGTYHLSLGVFSPDWSALYGWDQAAAPIAIR